MKTAATFFFLSGAIFLVGIAYFGMLFKMPGMYPPKVMLKKRIAALAPGAGISLLLALLFAWLA